VPIECLGFASADRSLFGFLSVVSCGTFEGFMEMGPGVMAFSMDPNAPKHRPPTTGSWWQHSLIDQSIHSTIGKQASTTHLKAPPEGIDNAI
jgi:hypothetical protein